MKMKWLENILPWLWGMLWVFTITMASLGALIWVAKWLFSLIGLI